jgi:hypothetical protein
LDRIKNTIKAITFKNPERIPLELVEIPGIFDDYHTVDREKVDKNFEGLNDFDVVQATYSWSFKDKAKDKEGNLLRKDEWGCIQKVPKDGKYSYVVIEEPLKNIEKIKDYKFPDSSAADDYFKIISKNIKERYNDKFIGAFIDPGITLVAINLRGYENLLVDYYKDFKNNVLFLFEGIWEYQKEIVKKWKEAGAHAVYLYEEWADQSNMYVSPEWWRENMKPFYKKVFSYIHDQGLFAGMGLDGKINPILDDLKEIGLDILDNRQPVLVGIENLAKAGGGKICIKGSCDMQFTLPVKSPAEVEKEAEMLVEKLGNERSGGFIAMVFKWESIKLPIENVLASLRGFNKYRKKY